MAVKPANSNYHTFTFNGVRAADYGIYVTDVNVFNSAARDVEYIQIPGRDGAFALDRGRFQNISVVYKCAMTQDTDEDFATAISEFRNAIASTKGYKRLEDDIHTDEYRMGVFSKGLEAPTLNTKTATFDVEFNCQPQRFLKSGENPRTIGGSVTNTQTESGSVVSIESDGGDKVTSLIAQIEPVQSGSGDPSPTNVRPITGRTAANVNVAGKNLLYHIYPSQTINGVEFVLRDDGTVVANGTATANAEFSLTYRISGTYSTTRLPHGEYIITGCPSGGGSSTYEIGINTTKNGSGVTMARDYGNGATFTMDSNALIGSLITIRRGVTVNNLIFKPMVRLASETDDTYEPYKGTTYPVSFGSAGTVYGGTVDVVTGVLTVTHKVVTYTSGDGWEWNASKGIARRWVSGMHNAGNTTDQYKLLVECDRLKSGSWAGSTSFTNYDYSCSAYFGDSIAIHIKGLTTLDEYKSWVTNNKPTFRYPLATPITVQLTAQGVDLLVGNSNVWADTGDITLTYGRDPNKIVNPTLFESHPLLHVWGYGDIGINDDALTIYNDEYGDVLLANRVTGSSNQDYINRASGYSLLNDGDSITLAAGSVYSINCIFDAAVNSISVSAGDGITTTITKNDRYATIFATMPAYTFQKAATADDLRKTATTITAITADGTRVINCSLACRFLINSFRTQIYFYVTDIAGSDNARISGTYEYNNSIQQVNGYSTQRPFADDADFYFDLDIGEAYKIEDGQTVSVNNAVTIPAQLPTLKSGENTITYDDTITRFNVVPRWWEV